MHEAQRQAREELTRLQLESCRADKSALQAQISDLRQQLTTLEQVHEANCRQSASLYDEVVHLRKLIAQQRATLAAWGALGLSLRQLVEGTSHPEMPQVPDVKVELLRVSEMTALLLSEPEER